MSREPTRHQLSSKLAYEPKTPTFLLKLQRKVAGRGEGDDEDEYEEDEFEDDGSGRPPIPRRPAIPERPDDNPGSADEDVDDEKPQVVVLKEGKHLSEREVENEKRKAMGLPPLVDPPPQSVLSLSSEVGGSFKKGAGLTFSSGGRSSSAAMKKKRKLADEPAGDGDGQSKKEGKGKASSKKKAKKSDKKLLSFEDGDP